MFFASDNAGPAHPQVLQAMAKAHEGYVMPYGNDPQLDEVRARLRALFDAPEAEVFLVSTGTAANALALAAHMRPWQMVYATPLSHIECDECNAPEFFTGGAKLTLVGSGHKMQPDELRAVLRAANAKDVHVPARGPVSLTQATEGGEVYALTEVAELTMLAKVYDLPVHMDGARFANAVAHLDCTPDMLSWRAGVDVLCFGGTKNGCPGVEAVILFDPAHARDLAYLRKRGGHLFSKHRSLSAQMLAYLTDDLWLTSARRANANAARLAAGLEAASDVQVLNRVEANMIFARIPLDLHKQLQAAGAVYYGSEKDDGVEIRMVCDWALQDEQIDAFLALI